jgi:hypothetical protein
MNLQALTQDQVKEYIHAEHQKGRSMREIVREVVAVRDDFILLSPDPQIAQQQTLDALGIPR